ncbi:MAG: asparagine synthase (glutamine-hydrolyzing) [Solirubrobacterales bacterium]
MCGISGVVYRDPAHPVDRDLLRRVTSVLSHRGPDADGFFWGPGAGLGHRRLSIIDLSTGDQPIYNEDRSKVVVFNGEIYNFQELRTALLQRGHRFTTSSDTEVLLHGWEEYGDGFVARLRGMFAFARWDLRARRLLLARDRVGKKPLYYTQDGERILFGSELKALITDPSLKRALSMEAIDDYLTFGAVPAPRTIYQNVQQVPPAHYLVWEGGRTRIVEYWDVAYRDLPARSEDECLEQFDSIFTEAVRLRLISDVPLGAFLSGGVDSTAVVATMASLLDRPVATTTVTFGERAFNEAPHARTVADTLGTDHEEVVVKPRAVDILPTLVWHLDEPFADSSAIPTYYVSQAARRRVTVALSGDGGDEVFAGYQWRYGLNLLEARLRGWIPGPVRRGVVGPLAAIWPKADRLPRPLRWKFLLRNLSLAPEQAYFNDMSLFTPADKRGLLTDGFRQGLNGHDPFTAFRTHFDRVRGLDHLRRILYVDLKTWLPNDILVKMDRMAMANSLEVRSPLLDHHVIDFAAGLPSEMKYHGRTSKYLLKRFAERRVPPSVIHRPKMGFSIPLASWLRGELRPMAEDLLLSERALGRSYFQAETIRGMWTRHQEGQRNHAHHLWALMVLELWHRMFVDESAPTEAALRMPGAGR